MLAKFKHRLLGTTILLLAGIIFLPDLLDGEKQVVKDDFKVIPDRPEFVGVQQLQPFAQDEFSAREQSALAQTTTDEVALDDPANSTNNASSAELPSENYAQVTVNAPNETNTAASATNSTVSSEVASSPVPAPGLNQAAWVVRVGSFSNPQNASALQVKLRQAGFSTFTRSITNSAGQPLTSVFVGPEIRRERLEQGLTKLQQLTGIERLIISNYQPTENN